MKSNIFVHNRWSDTLHILFYVISPLPLCVLTSLRTSEPYLAGLLGKGGKVEAQWLLICLWSEVTHVTSVYILSSGTAYIALDRSTSIWEV